MAPRGGKGPRGRSKTIINHRRPTAAVGFTPRVAEATGGDRPNGGERGNGGSSGSVVRSRGGFGSPPSGGGLQTDQRSIRAATPKAGGGLQTGQGSAGGGSAFPRRGPSAGEGMSRVRGASSNSSNHDSQATVSRTSIPTQYPPSTQTQADHQGPLTQPCSRLNPHPQHDNQLQNRDNDVHDHRHQVHLPQDNMEVEEESDEEENEAGSEEDDVEEEQQDYDQLLDDLISLPGRAHLPLLSPHPIPDKETTW